MLKANVGLSRKITRDYNSTGYSVNLDGEILASTDDAEAVNEKIKELFDLAQEALNREIDRDQGESAIGRRDEERPKSSTNGRNGHNGNGGGAATTSASTNGRNGHANGHQPTSTSAPSISSRRLRMARSKMVPNRTGLATAMTKLRPTSRSSSF